MLGLRSWATTSGSYFHSFTYKYPVVLAPFGKQSFLPFTCIETFVGKSFAIEMCVCVWGGTFHWFLSIGLCACLHANTKLSWLLQRCKKVWNQKIWVFQLFSFQCSFVYWGTLCCHIDCMISFFIPGCGEAIGILLGVTKNLKSIPKYFIYSFICFHAFVTEIDLLISV